MQSTEATTQKRPDLDALIQEVISRTFRDRYTAKEAKSLAMELAAALAAERDRADRAEARLADVWDEAARSANLVETNARLSIEHDPNPYRSEATA